ncbi:cytochrome c oxidase assembly factor 7 isoform X2 [Hypanus sabinus]|uniref:cytochrome c oxidase assembly factor 7 isoform X2 n=1 Tax=Hypanus sabinus TaxID=79690 RepID=UPI0028C49381|nr:cytochrome c oxidase assembly factor 7 isoform X2 [Hypanus sabinus]
MSGLVNFLDETEVKEYLDNLGVEYSYQCRKEKDPEGCQRLADYLEGIKKNYEAAAKILQHNCEENNHGESCYKLGSYYVTGKGGLQQNLKAAYECFVKSCEKGDVAGLAEFLQQFVCVTLETNIPSVECDLNPRAMVL